jgi:phosphatidylglycerophosphate synthase
MEGDSSLRGEATVTRKSLRESHPSWKARFDLVGGLWNYVVARPLSFLVTPLFIRLGFGATAVTAMGWVVLLCGLLLIAAGGAGSSNSIVGATLLGMWSVLDCVDGNIARYWGQCSRFGALLDFLASAAIVAFLPWCVGVGLYSASAAPPFAAGGLHFASWYWVAIGAVQSVSNLFRKGVTLRAELGVVAQDWSDRKITLWTVLPRAVLGFTLPLLLVAAAARALGIFLLFYTAYSVATSVAVVGLALRKAWLADRQQLEPGRSR